MQLQISYRRNYTCPLKVFFALTASIIMLGLFSAIANAQIALKLGSTMPANSPWGKWARDISGQIASGSGNDLKIVVSFDVKGMSEKQLLARVSAGEIDMALISHLALYANFPTAALFTLPYQYSGFDEAECVLQRQIATRFVQSPFPADGSGSSGFVPLAWISMGQNWIFSKDAIIRPADLAGKALLTTRSTGDFVLSQTFNANALPMEEIVHLRALQSGRFDVVIIPSIIAGVTNATAILKHLSKPGFGNGYGALVISAKTLKKLSPQARNYLRQFNRTATTLNKLIETAETRLDERFKADGITIHEFGDREIAEWKAVTNSALSDMAKQLGAQGTAISQMLEAAKSRCQTQ